MQDCPLMPSKKFKAFISKIIQKIVNVIEKLLRKTLFAKIVNENEFNIRFWFNKIETNISKIEKINLFFGANLFLSS